MDPNEDNARVEQRKYEGIRLEPKNHRQDKDCYDHERVVGVPHESIGSISHQRGSKEHDNARVIQRSLGVASTQTRSAWGATKWRPCPLSRASFAPRMGKLRQPLHSQNKRENGNSRGVKCNDLWHGACVRADDG
jgi:hypothetical protein